MAAAAAALPAADLIASGGFFNYTRGGGQRFELALSTSDVNINESICIYVRGGEKSEIALSLLQPRLRSAAAVGSLQQ